MIVFCINTFDSEKYITACDRIIMKIHELIKDRFQFLILCGVGGCRLCKCYKNNNTIYSCITENLSDHNIYLAVRQCVEDDGISPLLKREYKYVMIQDTMWPDETRFSQCIYAIENAQISDKFVFAHSLGLYNLGVATLDFLLERANEWNDIDILNKTDGILLETGRYVILNTKTGEKKQMRPLRHFTKHTLSNIMASTDGDLHNSTFLVDSISIGSVTDKWGNNKHYAYIASLGMYKMTHVPETFEVPIWVPPLVATTEEEWMNMWKNNPIWTTRRHFLPLLHRKI